MLSKFLKSIFGSRNDRILKKYRAKVDKINALEAGLEKVALIEFPQYTAALRERFAQGESLDDLLPEAFALVREASKRTLGMRPFDVQLMGGMALHDGKISEMSTGEGKTLSATLPAYLNALTGHSVHIVTVNDYLARRDRAWMAPLYHALGLTTGVVVPNMSREDKQAAYHADVIYATNNELGFDYLRDKMVHTHTECMQRQLYYAIVDEVDSILVDEARTPLIISGAAEDSSELYRKVNEIVPELVRQAEKEGPGDYAVDEKTKQAYLTEAGHERAEELLARIGLLGEGQSLYDPNNIMLMHHLTAALRAHAVYRRDVDYIVAADQVVIVDEHTGRTMPGRRWSDGLHQAIEAKEGTRIQSENQTLASITFQNFFRLYTKLAGMTGTADTEAYEFHQIYGLEVVVIPPNRKSTRVDRPDKVFLTTREKFAAILEEIKESVALKRPVLVGTISIETSEELSKVLQKNNIKHQVLNAKFHEQEAQIIAEAGRPGAVTIATNMAGRGTDIVLGGSLEAELKQLGENDSLTERDRIKTEWQKRHDAVVAAGGLHIIGTERHESRRIDNQLRGRAGRQGDPGSTQFFLSLEDNLMRIFGSDRMTGLMRKLGVKDGESITHPWITNAIENAQRKVESHNFDIRKQLLEYDNVANDQRQAIYQQRDELMSADDVGVGIENLRRNVIEKLVNQYLPADALEEAWNIEGLATLLAHEFLLQLPIADWIQGEKLEPADVTERILQAMRDAYQAKLATAGPNIMRHFEKVIMLHTLDQHWKEHLAQMDYLRQSIHLRGYAQKDPKQEFKREAFMMFASMLQHIKYEVIKSLARAEIKPEAVAEPAVDANAFSERALEYRHASMDTLAEQTVQAVVNGETPVASGTKVGRNEGCPCGSGKKYKHCHGSI